MAVLPRYISAGNIPADGPLKGLLASATSGVTARGPFTPFAFRLPLHLFHLLLRLPSLPRRRLLPLGTAVLVTLAATFWLSLVVVPIFLVLGLLLSTSVMRAS